MAELVEVWGLGRKKGKKSKNGDPAKKPNTMTYVLRQQTTTGWPYAEGEELTSQQGLHRRGVLGESWGIPGGKEKGAVGVACDNGRCRRVIYEAMRPFKTARNMSPEREGPPEELQAHED